jgi:hypothetical protein
VLEVSDACLWYGDCGGRVEKGTSEDHDGGCYSLLAIVWIWTIDRYIQGSVGR